MCRNGKPQPGVHPAGVSLDRRLHEFGRAGERDDVVELPGDLVPAHAHDGALHENVFTTREVGMKAGRHFDERSDTPANPAGAPSRLQDAGEEFQDGRLARPVGADDAHGLAWRHFERDILQRPEVLFAKHVGGAVAAQDATPEGGNGVPQRVEPFAPPELFPDSIDHDRRASHSGVLRNGDLQVCKR